MREEKVREDKLGSRAISHMSRNGGMASRLDNYDHVEKLGRILGTKEQYKSIKTFHLLKNLAKILN